MGGAISKNAVTASLDAVTKTVTNIIDQTTVSSQQGQGIIISGNTGGVTVGNITQQETLTVNTSALLNAMSTSSAQQDMVNNLSQTAKAVVSGINFGQYSDAENTASAFLKESIDIATNITNTCQTSMGQTQTIVITDNTGPTVVGSIVQSQVAGMFSSCVEKAVSNADAVQKMQNTLTQSATAKSEGLDFWGIVAIIALVILGIVGPITLVGSSLIKYFYVLLIIVGIAMIVIYFVWQPTNLLVTPYSAGFGASSGCSPSGATPVATTFKTPIDAANECKSNDKYVAFEWVGFNKTNTDGTLGLEISPPQTTFYTGIDPTCTVITDQTLSLFRRPSFSSGTTAPISHPLDTNGDYYVQYGTGSSNAQGWIFNTGWAQDSTTWNIPPNYSVTFGIGPPPSLVTSSTYYVDISNPKSCMVYKSDTVWVPVGLVSGPGYAPITSQYTNTSGFKQKGTKPWLLYVGGTALAMGFISMVISIVYSSKTKEDKV